MSQKLTLIAEPRDDLVDTAGTLCAAAEHLKKRGAVRVLAFCTHAVLSGKAIDNIENSALDELVVTDTIPLNSSCLLYTSPSPRDS